MVVMIAGTAGFHALSRGSASWVDSLYMTFITVTTIGYGEIVEVGKMPHGRLYTMLIALAGIGAFTFLLTNFTAIIVSGDLKRLFYIKKSERVLRNMKGHYIICGSGDIGYQIANELSSTKRIFCIIDKSEPTTLKESVLFIKGDATDAPVLEKAGIMKAKGVFAVTGDDNYNLVITLTAKQLNPNVRVVAKCRDQQHYDKMRKVGADSVVMPIQIGSLRIVSEMIRPTVVSFLDTMLRDRETNLRVEEVKIHPRFIGKTVEDTGIRNFRKALLLAIRTDGEWAFNPEPERIITENDIFVVMVEPDLRLQLRKMIGVEEQL